MPPIEAYRIRARIVQLDQGAHRLRYVERPGSQPEAFFLVTIFPEDMKFVAQPLSAEGAGSELRKPGDELIVRARQPIRMMINTVFVGSSGGALLEIDRLDIVEAAERPATARVDLLS